MTDSSKQQTEYDRLRVQYDRMKRSARNLTADNLNRIIDDICEAIEGEPMNGDRDDVVTAVRALRAERDDFRAKLAAATEARERAERECSAAIARASRLTDIGLMLGLPPDTDPQEVVDAVGRMRGAGDGVKLISAERRRQVEGEGWTPAHDDEHDTGELAIAAACYCIADHSIHGGRAPGGNFYDTTIRTLWPWSSDGFKPSEPIRNLVKAGALIAAEIDRLKRAEQAALAAQQRKEGE